MAPRSWILFITLKVLWRTARCCKMWKNPFVATNWSKPPKWITKLFLILILDRIIDLYKWIICRSQRQCGHFCILLDLVQIDLRRIHAVAAKMHWLVHVTCITHVPHLDLLVIGQNLQAANPKSKKNSQFLNLQENWKSQTFSKLPFGR